MCVVQKVEGVELGDMQFDKKDKRVHLEADALGSGLTRYFTDVYKNGGSYMSELYVRQFMFGKCGKDADPHFYLVDIDLIEKTLQKRNQEPDSSTWHFLNSGINTLREVCQFLEGRFGEESLYETNKYLKKLSQMLLENEKIKSNINIWVHSAVSDFLSTHVSIGKS